MKILVTGSAGFIGYHLTLKLLKNGNDVVGLDNINDYYDISIKYGRLKELGIYKENIVENNLIQSSLFPNHQFIQSSLCEKDVILKLFKEEQFDVVCNLAAQAGVRYSLVNPYAYVNSNITGFLNILEACRFNTIKHLVYASSSSVYGLNKAMPFSPSMNVDHPVNLYAATKKSNELMAHTYSHLYQIPTTGLRFFTVYGPWGRPDMALFLFAKAIIENKAINIFNNGQMSRDFTYVDDIVDGILKVIDSPAKSNSSWDPVDPDPASSQAPYKLYNIGNNSPVKLLDFIKAIEDVLGKKAKRTFMPLQAGDVPATWADVKSLQNDFNYSPSVPIEVGIKKFINWYKAFYSIG